ncbi:MAG: hypothetical protein DRH44_00430 [Candidatus Coatesbacteria bacterium]|nr:MAG: hypothetical protein DRH44_00430 [Candidatus Coatesbacteria bacterium]
MYFPPCLPDMKNEEEIPENIVIELNQARKAIDTEDFPKATRHLQRIVKQKVDFWPAWLQLASIYATLGSYEKALECLEKVFDISPAHQEAWKLKIECLISLNRYSDVIPSINGYLSTYDDSELFETRTDILFALGEFEEVINIYLELLKKEPKIEYVKNICQAFIYMGRFAQVLDWLDYLRDQGYDEEWMDEFKEEADLGMGIDNKNQC